MLVAATTTLGLLCFDAWCGLRQAAPHASAAAECGHLCCGYTDGINTAAAAALTGAGECCGGLLRCQQNGQGAQLQEARTSAHETGHDLHRDGYGLGRRGRQSLGSNTCPAG